MLLQLSLCFVTVIQLTSSQPTYDVIQQEYDVDSCGRTEQLLSQMATSESQLHQTMTQLWSQVVTAVSHLQQTVSQLHEDVTRLKGDIAELKAGKRGYSLIKPL